MLFSVWDVETTGLRKHRDVLPDLQPRIIEFAGIITDGEAVIDFIQFRCNPGEPLEGIITKITGITDDMLKDQPTFPTRLAEVGNYFSQSAATISHNLSFDSGMLDGELARNGGILADVYYPRIQVCSVEQTMPLFGRRMKLTELYERAIGPAKDAHSAMGDVNMLHQVCIAYGIYDAIKEANGE